MAFRKASGIPPPPSLRFPPTGGNDYFDDVYVHNGKEKQFKGYCADVFFNEAKRFISESAEKKKPFLCYVATNTPHGPFWPKDEDRKAIAEVLADPKFDHLNSGLKNRLSLYLGMIRNIDWNMGELMKFLDDEGLTDDTILIFKTDNGSLLGPQYFNAGMRGKKTEIWEGGHRVPCFIRWPKGGLGNHATSVV